jgi:GNAT superfamily N-acetyltransferase
VQVQQANASDGRAIAQVQVDSWHTSYRGIVPDALLDELHVEERVHWWERVLTDGTDGRFTFVAEDETGQIVGYASGGPSRSQIPCYAGEIYAIYLVHSHQRRGIGRQPVATVAAQLARDGRHSMLLWVFKENWAARRFYERLGGRLIGSKPMELAGVELEEVAYGWPDSTALIEGVEAGV